MGVFLRNWAQAAISGNVGAICVLYLQRKEKHLQKIYFPLPQPFDGEITVYKRNPFFLSVFPQILKMTEQTVLNLPPLPPQKGETLEVSISGTHKHFHSVWYQLDLFLLHNCCLHY